VLNPTLTILTLAIFFENVKMQKVFVMAWFRARVGSWGATVKCVCVKSSVVVSTAAMCCKKQLLLLFTKDTGRCFSSKLLDLP